MVRKRSINSVDNVAPRHVWRNYYKDSNIPVPSFALAIDDRGETVIPVIWRTRDALP